MVEPFRPQWDREFAFGDQEFRELQSAAAQHAGIHLSDAKRELVYSRLARRIRALGLRSFAQYCDRLARAPDEIEHFTNAITTNLTSFFREGHHFLFLRDHLIPGWLAAHNGQSTRALKIWCAGCSTGEEPYSVAATALTALAGRAPLDVLATDLDSEVLAFAAAGTYSMERISGIPEDYLKRWFLKGQGAREGLARAGSDLHRVIRFRRHNLVHDPAPRALFDIVFCRNVVIYFDRPTQAAVFSKLISVLRLGGHLMVGHSESLQGRHPELSLVSQSTYRRVQ